MKKYLSYALLVTLFLFNINCTSVSKTMSSWVGSTKGDLYQSWGPPSRVTDDGQGGEILIYESSVRLAQQPGTITSNYGQINYTTPQNNGYVRSRMFYVNKEGKIYNWRWQGL